MKELDLSENEKLVLSFIEDEIGCYYRDLEEETKIKKSELKKIIKKLKYLDLIVTVSLLSNTDDGGYYGKGFILTTFGYNYKQEFYIYN